MPDGRHPAPGGWNRLVLEVDDLDALIERLGAARVPFRNEPISGPGGRQVVVEDPSGNPVELFQA
jgi:catechol 2,3-dioxygenase-like lactoylglutathione lyase family enzyme